MHHRVERRAPCIRGIIFVVRARRECIKMPECLRIGVVRKGRNTMHCAIIAIADNDGATAKFTLEVRRVVGLFRGIVDRASIDLRRCAFIGKQGQCRIISGAGIIKPSAVPDQRVGQDLSLKCRHIRIILLAPNLQNDRGILVVQHRPVDSIPAPAAIENFHRCVGARALRKNPAVAFLPAQRSIEPDHLTSRIFMARQPLENHCTLMLYSPLRIIDAAGSRIRALGKNPGGAVPAKDHAVPAVLRTNASPIRLTPCLHLAHAHHKIGCAPGRAQQTTGIWIQNISRSFPIYIWLLLKGLISQPQRAGGIAVTSTTQRIQRQSDGGWRRTPERRQRA